MRKGCCLSLLLSLVFLFNCVFLPSIYAEETAPADGAVAEGQADALPADRTVVESQAGALPAPESVVQPPAAPTEEPVAAPAPEPATASISEPAAAPVSEPLATAAPAPEPVAAPAPEPAPEPEPATASVSEPAVEPVSEPLATAAPAPEPVAAPAAEPAPVPAQSDAAHASASTSSPASGLSPAPSAATTESLSGMSGAESASEPDETTRSDSTLMNAASAEDDMRSAGDNTGTFSMTLRNRVYGYTERTNLAAVFHLFILKTFLPSLPDTLRNYSFALEGDAGSEFWLHKVTLDNMKSATIQGIPSTCPVTVSVHDVKDEYKDENSTDDENDTHEFTTSYIINNEYKTDSTQELNTGRNASGDMEYTLMRFTETNAKTLVLINDSDSESENDTPLELTLDGLQSSCTFYYPKGSGKENTSISLTPEGPKTILLNPGEYGYLVPFAGNGPSSNADLSSVTIHTPTNAEVSTGVSSVGTYDKDSHVMTLGSVPSGDPASGQSAYVLFRVEEPKTGTEIPKTDDNNNDPEKPANDDPDNPDPHDNPADPVPDSDPQTPNPESAPGNPTPENPGKGAPTSTHTTITHGKRDKGSPDSSQPAAGTTVSQRAPSEGTAPSQIDAVDTADHSPIEMYVVMMLISALFVFAVHTFACKKCSKIF